MITDMVDLEPLVGRYDPGMILVGPLLSHSKNSRYHYFYIAGDGSKIYETIILGFVKVETIARTQTRKFCRETGESLFGGVGLWRSPRDGASGPCALAKCGDSQAF